jgi:hypothetical protein
MRSTDYPHQAATWPRSKDFIEQNLVELPDVDRRKIVRENTAKLYRFPIAAEPLIT